MVQRLTIDGPFVAHLRPRNVSTRATGLVTAAEAVGPIERGGLSIGVTKGAWSMLDFIEHILATTGRADVAVSTWTMGVYDADVLWRFVQNSRIGSIRFLLDPSMFSRSPELARAFVAAFGGENIRAFHNHAKFTLVSNAEWHVVVASSMNLNRNSRMENFVLIEDRQAWEFYSAIVDAAFRQLEPYSRYRATSEAEFKRLSLDGTESTRDDEIW